MVQMKKNSYREKKDGGRGKKSKPVAVLACWFIAFVIAAQSLLMMLRNRSLPIDVSSEPWLKEFLGSEPDEVKPRISAKDLETIATTYVQSFKSLDRPLIFFHVPKTAGTAIEYAAGEKKIPWGSCLFKHKPKRDICHYPEGEEWPMRVGWWHLPRSVFPLANVDPYTNAELFAVTRDPYDRMVSEYNYICTLKILDWRPNQCDRDRLYDKEYMNEWLSEKLREKERDTALGYLTDNGHFTPQFDFIVGPHNVRMIDHVLSLDDGFSTGFENLMEAFGLSKIRLQKLNALGAEDRDEDKNLNVAHLGEETVGWIHDLYSHDFGFGYSKRDHP